MTPPLLIVIPVTVLASAVSATVHDLLPVPPEDVKAEDVVAVPYVVDGLEPSATATASGGFIVQVWIDGSDAL